MSSSNHGTIVHQLLYRTNALEPSGLRYFGITEICAVAMKSSFHPRSPGYFPEGAGSIFNGCHRFVLIRWQMSVSPSIKEAPVYFSYKPQDKVIGQTGKCRWVSSTKYIYLGGQQRRKDIGLHVGYLANNHVPGEILALWALFDLVVAVPLIILPKVNLSRLVVGKGNIC